MEKDRLSRYTDTELKYMKITDSTGELPKEYLEAEKKIEPLEKSE